MAHTATEQIRVIIADDHPIVREGLAAILGSQEDIKIVAELLMARRPANSMISFLPTSLCSISGCRRRTVYKFSLN
jgi:hypothetical protein